MIKDAEANAEADKKQVELVQARNSAESVYFNFKKDFDQYKDKVTEDERTKASEALSNVEKALEGDDVEAINNAVAELYQSFGPILSKKQETTEEETVVDAEVK